MRLVIDTNILLVSVSSRSQYQPLFRSLTSGVHTWVVSHEILMEYVEMLEALLSPETSVYIEKLLTEAPYILHIEPEFKWRLLNDADDNKFADAYVAADADYIVTEDKHFAVLSNIEWPKIKVIGLRAFLQIIADKNRNQ